MDLRQQVFVPALGIYEFDKTTFSVFKLVVDMTLNIKGRIFEQIDVNPLIDDSWGQLME